MFKKVLSVIFVMMFAVACKTGSTSGSGVDGSVIPGTQSDLEANIGDRIFFGFDKSTLSEEAQATLNRQADWLKQYSDLRVVIEGHADERGTREYNLALGERRANAVKKYLANIGIAHDRISTISYGKERPAVIGSGEEVYSQNRRAVTVVTQ